MYKKKITGISPVSKPRRREAMLVEFSPARRRLHDSAKRYQRAKLC